MAVLNPSRIHRAIAIMAVVAGLAFLPGPPGIVRDGAVWDGTVWDGAAWAQNKMPNLLELRKVIAFRDIRNGGDPAATIEAARTYLAEFRQGDYRDEVLLGMSDALGEAGKSDEALDTYQKIIDDHPDSPFREQAMAGTIPLLMKTGKEEAAFARMDALLKNYPASVLRNQTLLWLADAQYGKENHKAVLKTLERVETVADLAQPDQTNYYRLRTLALVKQGESAWTSLNRYLKRKDSAEHKAEVLTLVGEIARKAGRDDEALRYYRQVVEDFPVLPHLESALYWRAELFNRTRMSQAPAEVRTARRETAIGYYSAYIKGGGKTHIARALLGRGGLLLDGGEPEKALEDYDRAVKLEPAYRTGPPVIRKRVKLYLALERKEDALALLDEARQEPSIPANERTAFQIEEARLYYEDEQCGKVVALLNPMPIIPDPATRPKAFFMRGFCRYQQGEWEKATFDLEGLINDPQYQELALQPLLDAYEKSGQASRLVNLAEELLRAGRVKGDRKMFVRLAKGYEMLGEPALMLSAYQRLEKVDPEAVRTPEIQAGLGEAREKLGRKEEATANYKLALELILLPEGEPPPLYLATLDRLHELYLGLGRLEELQALHAKAETDLAGKEALARMDGWRLDLQLAEGRMALDKGDPQAAILALEASLLETGPEVPQRRIALASLLMLAHLRWETPDKAAETYREEAKQHQDSQIRSELSAAVLSTLGEKPDASIPEENRRALIAVYSLAFQGMSREDPQSRHKTAKTLDRLYKDVEDFGSRAALITSLLKDGLDEKTKEELKRYQSSIYKNWGAARKEKGDWKGARFHLNRALQLVDREDWRKRYEIVALLGAIHLEMKEFTELVLLTEDVLPTLRDEQLAAQVRHYLGQVHVEWGKAADDESNTKSARIRYYRALDYLPASDWQRRLTAANGLSTALMKENKTSEAAGMLEKEIPGITDESFHQQYALYVGRLYLENLKNEKKAVKWLKAADRKKNDPLSLEAGYLLADRHLKKNPQGTLSRLRELVKRNITGSKWKVPIHYRLAILYHRQKQLRKALSHYRIVAGVKDEEVRKIYPRSIKQSAQQVLQIEKYLKSSQQPGGNIAVPKVSAD